MRAPVFGILALGALRVLGMEALGSRVPVGLGLLEFVCFEFHELGI